MFTETELAYFDELPGAVEDPFSFFGFHRPGSGLRARWAEHGLVQAEHGTLAVDLEGAVIGDVQWHAVPYGPPPLSNAYNIGIRLLPQHRGQGNGTEAQRALVGYLFATYPINRIEAGTDTANLAEQRALEKVGFVKEGILRGAQWRSGDWHDLVLYSCLRSDPRS